MKFIKFLCIVFLCDMLVLVVYPRRKTYIIFQLFSFFLQYSNGIYMIVIEFVLLMYVYIYIHITNKLNWIFFYK